jgi:hypothetical protein
MPEEFAFAVEKPCDTPFVFFSTAFCLVEAQIISYCHPFHPPYRGLLSIERTAPSMPPLPPPIFAVNEGSYMQLEAQDVVAMLHHSPQQPTACQARSLQGIQAEIVSWMHLGGIWS